MSANSDSKQLIDMAEKHGLTVEKAKHGGYAILNSGGAVVARVRSGGSQPWHAVRSARRAIRKHGRA